MIRQILFAGLFALSAVACGSNECEDAEEKVKDECGITLTPELQKQTDRAKEECTGTDECAAKCVNDASCEELKSEDENSDYVKCLSACISG
jgi:hypothetical protein